MNVHPTSANLLGCQWLRITFRNEQCLNSVSAAGMNLIRAPSKTQSSNNTGFPPHEAR